MTGIVRVCDNEIAPIGSLSCQKGNPFLDIVSVILLKPGFKFDTFVKFATLSEWLKAVRSEQLIPIHGVIEIDDNTEDAQYYESGTGKRIPRRDGNYRNVFRFMKSLQVHKAMQSMKGADFEVILIDSAGYIKAYSPDGISARGFSVDMFNVEKMTSPGQDNTPAFTPVVIDQADPKEWNVKGIAIKPGWLSSEIQPLSSVVLTVVSKSATEIVVNVSYNDGLASDGNVNKVGIGGILEADFVFTTTTPTAESMVYLGDGNYKFIGVGMVSGSIDLKAPDVATTTGDPIKSTGAAIITIE